MAAAANDFSQGKVWRRIMSQAIPLTLAEIVHLLYNVVDRVYIGHLSSADSMALTGVGLIFPIVSLIGAFTSLFGTGGTPLFSIARGARKEEKASRIQSMVFILLLYTSLALTALCYIFKRPVLYLFGASDASYPYADAYLTIYLLGTPFTMLATGLNGFINAQGFPRVGMLTTMLGAALNLALDPLFIFVFNMGVRGAAIATVISQAVSCLWVLRFLSGKKALIPLRREHMRVERRTLKDILSLGVVGFIMKGTNSLVQIVCNATLQSYGGDLYVGVMTVVNSVREILFLPVSGISSGAQPVISFNYGAQKYSRVRQGIKFMTIACTVYTTVSWIAVLMFPRFFVGIFSSDAALLATGPAALNLYFFGFFFMAFQSSGQSAFQALGDARHAITFSLFRKVVIVVPLTLLLPRLGFGVDGVFMAEPVSNLLGGLACYITMLLTVYRRMGRMQEQAC
ncbi:MAG: MATE family efflux transporter [Clostridia bacterium]|nr:MATE family efflux transporter [Clostridia bacterium]